MGIYLEPTLSQYLQLSSPPFTAPPFSIWGWAYVADLAGGDSFGDRAYFTWNAAASNFALYRLPTPAYAMWGGTSEASGGVPAIGRWFFWVWRYIATNNKRLSIFGEAGDITHLASTNTTAVVATNLNLGVTNAGSVGTDFWWGGMAEIGLTNTDIMPGGGVMDNTLLRQLAYYGPFSIGHIAASIGMYMPLNSQTGLGIETPAEGSWGSRGRMTWTAPNGYELGPHPPMLGNYSRKQMARIITPF